MCSWCWAFRPAWRALQQSLSDSVDVRYVMGGLAPDSDAPMDESMRGAIQETWRTIERRTGATFNHDFWRLNTPRRSTWPACRAAIAAGFMRAGALAEMVEAIQRAYYERARNPSLDEELCDIAATIGLDPDRFADCLHSREVRGEFASHLELTRRMGVQGFPAVIATARGEDGSPRYALVSAGYADAGALLRSWSEVADSLAA